jgi:Protein of unknown function (DUF4232)
MVKTVLAACALSVVALGAAACGGTAQAAPPSPSASTNTSTSTASSPTTTTPQAQAGGPTTASLTHVPACGNDDLKISFGYGTQSDPHQAVAVVFKNISIHTCILQGYPGATIKDGSTVIDATRVLNGERGDLPPLSSPPRVTLSSGGVAYAVLEWLLHTNQTCYPAGSGTFEITAPNTTKTVVIGTGGHMGVQGICSAFEVSPVVPGVFGVAAGS